MPTLLMVLMAAALAAGPAFAAPTPVKVKMPVPTIAPTPSAIRCGQDKVGFSRCSGAISSADRVLRTPHMRFPPNFPPAYRAGGRTMAASVRQSRQEWDESG